MSSDPLVEYLDDGPEVKVVGGPLDGTVYVSESPTSFWSYLHDDGTKAKRGDFSRTPPRGYVHWCGRTYDTGQMLHCYVHGSAIASWLERSDARPSRPAH